MLWIFFPQEIQPYSLIGEGDGNPLWYSCLENYIDRGAWQAAIHGVAKNRAQLSNSHLFTYV